MANDRLPYTYCSIKRLKTGRTEYWRFRRAGLEAKLPGNPLKSTEALRKYTELMEQADRAEQQAEGPARHSFEWLARAYLAGPEFAQLAVRTQDDYTKVLENRLIPALGPERFDCIDRRAIKLVRDAVLEEGLSARTANKIKQVASLLYSWAEDEELLPSGFVNPGQALKKLKGKSKSIEIWSAEEIALFLAAGPAHLRTAAMLALYTGQRIGDVVAMEWTAAQALDTPAPMIRVRQNKTHEPLTVPCHPALADHLREVRTRFGGPIVRAADGKPTNENAICSALHRAVRKIDNMPARSWHGLRYAAAGALEAAGCTVVQISSIVGHRTYQMAMKYAEQRRAAEAAMAKLQASV